jgi:hypothetical protein
MKINFFKNDIYADLKSVEAGISQRRSKISSRRSSLLRTITLRVTASKFLLATAGVGFIIGELTKSSEINVKHHGINQVKTNSIPLRSAVQEVGRYAALTYSALNSWPAIALMSFIRSNKKNADSNNTTLNEPLTGTKSPHKHY